MNTKITVTSSSKGNDNLIILADKSSFEWANGILTASEVEIVKDAAQKDIPYIFLPQNKKIVVIQFLKKSSNENNDKEDARIAGYEILSLLAHYKVPTVFLRNESSQNRSLEYLEGMVLGNYQFLKYFNDKKEKEHKLKEIKVSSKTLPKKEIETLVTVTRATCKARDLVNEPQSFLSATQLSEEIKIIGKEFGFTVKVLNKKKIEAMKMGGVIAVNRGSETPPTFNILEWKPAKAKNKKPIVLVGKGIVYDTGGLSLKPTAHSMDFMKSDMAGAATVVGTIAAAAKSKLPLHIIALVPATDNRPGKDAYAPGDVITMYDGTTVEVLNTDAEGRLVLADALHYAKKYKPELVLDFATLTGSAVRATGPEAICFMGTADTSIKEKIETSGYSVYERLVEFPLWREYGEQLKSNIADIKNLGGPTAGMITAGKFLQHFTSYPWLHFDIAGPAYLQKADAYRTKEGTGVGVRLLYNFLQNY